MIRVIKLQDGETVQLIELYAKERLLYDSSCNDYNSKELRLAAAKRISKGMGIPGFGPREVITKFKNLRSSYCQELKKIAEGERTGMDYVPKVVWFSTMNSFIRPFVQQRQTKYDLVIPIKSSPPASENEISLQYDSDDQFSENISNHTNSSSYAIKRKAPTETWTLNKKKTVQDPLYEAMFNAETSEPAEIPKDDSFDHFGKYISSLLRIIGLPNALKVQEKIIGVISNEMCPPS